MQGAPTGQRRLASETVSHRFRRSPPVGCRYRFVGSATARSVELTPAGWVSWWNERRLHEACGYVPPAEFEENHYRRLGEASSAA
jgi:transposase InsO family protein